ncbi:EAL domain-containing protein [Pseudothauera nasutitermitis]|uniref:EAL domain-containing protein n=1 Tax=Pseudothauera nasutitermitis TaxID=2565930 RepID=A0A4S4B1H1_9RHOO|nr:EAL domain-containing protein [Pseudothauera nasutitermitis]THF66411.1 EAL domain-containing protein [Pseudothauera nasutitermitis]
MNALHALRPIRSHAGTWLRARCARLLAAVLLGPGALAGAQASAPPNLLSTVLRQHTAVMLFVEPDSGRIVDANAAAERFYGFGPRGLIGRGIDEINTLGADEVAAERSRAQAEQRNYFVFPHRLASGEIRTVEVHSSPIRLYDGKNVLFSIVHDITGKEVAADELLAYKSRLEELVTQRTREAVDAQQRTGYILAGALLAQLAVIIALAASAIRHRRTARELKRREQQLSTLIDNLPDVVQLKDDKGRWQRANRYALELFGLENVDYHGLTDTELCARQDGSRRALLGHGRSDEAAWAAGGAQRSEESVPTPDGQTLLFDVIKVPLFHADGRRNGLLSIGRDITERRRAESEVARLAYYDPLTNLPNRRLVLDRLGHALAVARRSGHYGALLLIDLDYFKTLNDARGHEMGDRLLKAAGERLAEGLRESDTLARFGGDEFVLLLPEISPHQQLAADMARGAAEKTRNLLGKPFDLGGEQITIGASIGVSIFPATQSGDVSELVKQADTALYQAKAAGRNAVRFFEPEMQARAEMRFTLEAELRQAIDNNELRLYVQPQFDGQQRMRGAEVLLRWHHPRRGLIWPGSFVPIAEETGLIVELGDWVLRRACGMLTRPELAEGTLRISVNVSPRQFHHAGFVARVRDILAETGADPARLTFEVTEGLVIDKVHQTVATMSELNALGIHFSVDDFGTGYSSLAYLKRLPIQELKIDRSFIQDAPSDPNDAALVDTILSIAAHLHLDVVAEGVETEAQAAFLATRAPMLYQGYLYARPEPEESFLARLRDASRR